MGSLRLTNNTHLTSPAPIERITECQGGYHPYFSRTWSIACGFFTETLCECARARRRVSLAD